MVKLVVPNEEKSTIMRSLNKQIFDSLTTGLLQLLSKIFACLTTSVPVGTGQTDTIKIKPDAKTKLSPADVFNGRIQDIISYTINIGLIDKLYGCFISMQGPLDESPKVAVFLQAATTLLHELCRLCISVTPSSWDIFESHQDPTGLSAVFQSSDLVGVLHMLYCALFHNSSSEPNVSSSKESYEQNTIQVAIQSLRFLNSFATLHLQSFQAKRLPMLLARSGPKSALRSREMMT
ncbi:unnamed protein product [Ranitomeya imitator]|uniref:Uncharacterized protein n=1 Tax=Ranitomeya imitator TaxID=111125 RepID=A0ABN9MDM4_9NEOB|nr:unnamed protein product [Ranitomeya imitator]